MINPELEHKQRAWSTTYPKLHFFVAIDQDRDDQTVGVLFDMGWCIGVVVFG